MPTQDELKEAAAEAAAALVEDGMIMGLGSGSTAAAAVRAIGRLVAQGVSEPGGVEVQHQQLGLVGEEEVGNALNLPSVGAVDESLGGQGRIDVGAGGGQLPHRPRHQVVDHSYRQGSLAQPGLG